MKKLPVIFLLLINGCLSHRKTTNFEPIKILQNYPYAAVYNEQNSGDVVNDLEVTDIFSISLVEPSSIKDYKWENHQSEVSSLVLREVRKERSSDSADDNIVTFVYQIVDTQPSLLAIRLENDISSKIAEFELFVVPKKSRLLDRNK